MTRFQIHYNKIIKYDLANTFLFKNVFEIPKITKITLSLSSPKMVSKKKKLLSCLICLEILTGIQGRPIRSKKNKIQLKIKKNDIVGCQIVLTKKKIYTFLELFILQILPNMENKVNLKIDKNNYKALTINVPNLLKCPILETELFRFPIIPSLQVNIQTNCKSILQTKFLLQSFNLPVK